MILRTQFDDSVLELPAYAAIMPDFEKSAPTVSEFHQNIDGWCHAADIQIGINSAGDVDITNRNFSGEARTRRMLAFYGFKPDRDFARPGYPISLRFSRVQDLEAVSEVRSTTLVVDSRIQSHVVPYVFATISHGGGDLNLNTLGYTANGLLLPWPWPRVLNCYRLVRKSDNRVVYPRASVPSDPTRTRHDLISNNGTMVFSQALDSAMSANGVITLAAGDYDIEIGHVEPQPTTAILGLSNMPFGPERWPSAATP